MNILHVISQQPHPVTIAQTKSGLINQSDVGWSSPKDSATTRACLCSFETHRVIILHFSVTLNFCQWANGYCSARVRLWLTCNSSWDFITGASSAWFFKPSVIWTCKNHLCHLKYSTNCPKMNCQDLIFLGWFSKQCDIVRSLLDLKLSWRRSGGSSRQDKRSLVFQISAKLLCEVKNCEVSNSSFKVLIFVSIRIMMMTGPPRARFQAIKTVVYIIN